MKRTIRFYVIIGCFLLITGCSRETIQSSPITIQEINQQRGLVGADAQKMKNDFDFNSNIISKQELLKLSNEESKDLYVFPIFHQYKYQNISFIFARKGDVLTSRRSNIYSMMSGDIEVIVADPEFSTGTKIKLVKIYDYKGDTITGAAGAIYGNVYKANPYCEPLINEGGNTFTMKGNNKFDATINTLTGGKDAIELFIVANIPCTNGGEHYEYIWYPKLKKIFGILAYGKNGNGWKSGEFGFYGIKDKNGIVQKYTFYAAYNK